MNKRVKILVAYHKPAELLKSEVFIPIQVGRTVMREKNKDGKLSYFSRNWLLKNLIGDDTGENISDLNRFFNEMSAKYWGWKNQTALDNPDYIGLMHYRRHFIFSEVPCKKEHAWLNNSPVYCFESIDNKYKRDIVNETDLYKLTESYDIICSKPYNANDLNDGHYYKGAKERFSEVSKTPEIWYEKMCVLINTKYPEYNAELQYLNEIPSHYLCNMFVMKKELFDKYCEFAFDILLNLYEDFKKENLDIWQARAIGFLAEFLTSIFISNYKKKHPNKVKELDLTYVENTDLNFGVKNFAKKIFSVKKVQANNRVYKVITLCGLKFKREKNKLQRQLTERIHRELEMYSYEVKKDIRIKLQASIIHTKSFYGYKNIYNGREVVLCADGASMYNFEPVENAIYVGADKAFLNKKINFDYLFIEKYLEKGNLQQQANAYIGNKCQKFYGRSIYTIFTDSATVREIPVSDFIAANAKEYILNYSETPVRNLETEPICDMFNTMFSAVQFILYTHPKRIYLVGCDCIADNTIDKKQAKERVSIQINGWRRIKEFAAIYYPDIEFVSINPFGLRGMFKDEYYLTNSIYQKNESAAMCTNDDELSSIS